MKPGVLAIASLCFISCSTLKKPIVGNSELNLPQLYSQHGHDVIVIAHRGASADRPENTMAAFTEAVRLQADMIELDVMLSKDGVPVVFHDAMLNAHTNGTGPVKSLSLKQLQNLDAGSWFDKSYAGEPIPTLEEVLAFASGKIALNIEIKTEAVTDKLIGGIEEKSVQLVKKYGMQKYVMFSSFDYRAVAHLKKLAPSASVALLYEKKQSAAKLPSALVTNYKADAFNCSYRQFNKRWMKDLAAQGIPVFIYTVDRQSRMRKLIKKGVKGIFTNRPDVLIETLEN